MRRQYHSRQVSGHEFVWDVHRLIELSAGFPIKEIPVAQIAELDEQFWFNGTTKPTCREIALHAQLIQETDLTHPIILSADGRVMDGMHRVCKALLEKRVAIQAVQFQQDPNPDYIDADIDALPYDEPWQGDGAHA